MVGGVTPQTHGGWLDAGANGFGLGGALYKAGQSAEETLAKARAYRRGGETLMRPLKIAIIGFGKIAADQHVPAIAGNDRASSWRRRSAGRARDRAEIHRLARDA